MQLKRWIFIAGFAFLTFIFSFIPTANAQTPALKGNYTLQIATQKMPYDKAILYIHNESDSSYDTTYLSKSNPLTTISSDKLAESEIIKLRIKDREGNQPMQELLFYLTPGKTLLSFDEQRHLFISHPNAFQKEFASFIKERQDYATLKSPLTVDSLEESYDTYLKSFIKTHQRSPISMLELQEFALRHHSESEVEDLFSHIHPRVQELPIGQNFIHWLLEHNETELDKPNLSFSTPKTKAFNFILPDTNGQPISLEQFKGKYVLIHFWASWSDSSLARIAQISNLYKKYNNDSLAVIGISLNEVKAKWLNAIDQYHMEWTQLSDLKGWDNAAVKGFGVNYLPQNILIDKQGFIIGRNLSPEQLNAKMESLFSGESTQTPIVSKSFAFN